MAKQLGNGTYLRSRQGSFHKTILLLLGKCRTFNKNKVIINKNDEK